MKKTFAKQLIMGTMALSLIGGAGALITQNTFAAASTAAPAAAADAPSSSKALHKEHQSLEVLKEVNDQLISFLKLDKATFETKIATQTLAQIAADQGISRESLKAELTAEVNAQLDKEKADFAQNIDKALDATRLGKQGEQGDHKKTKIDLSGTASLLGFASAAEFKSALGSGKSIADLATEKGVAVQSVIDLQVNQIVKSLDQQLADQKITQAQYDKQKTNSVTIATKIVNGKRDMNKQGPKHKQDDNNKQDDNEVNDDAAQTNTPSTKANPTAK